MDSRRCGNDRPMRLLILALFAFLAACGQSGDLYLPEAKPAPVVSAPQAPAVVPPVAEPKKDEEQPQPATETAPAPP